LNNFNFETAKDFVERSKMDKKKERVQSGLPKGRSTSNNRNGNGVSGVQSNG